MHLSSIYKVYKLWYVLKTLNHQNTKSQIKQRSFNPLRSMKGSAFLNVLMESAGLLNESRKLFTKNKKLMLSVVVLPLIIHCVVCLLNIISMKHVAANLMLEAGLLPTTDPSSPDFAGLLMRVLSDIRLLVESVYIILFVYSLITLLFSVAVVSASAITHTGKNINIKEFLILTTTSLKQPLVTSFYITLFAYGYLLMFLITLFPVMLFSQNPFSLKARSITLWFFFAVFQSYLEIVWNLSLIISVLEETYGIQALGKAARIAKGSKLKLFLVNLLISVVSIGLGQGTRFAHNVVVMLVVVSSLFLVSMFRAVVYTVSYFHCKSIHGEEVDLQSHMEYGKIPSELLVSDNV